MNLSQILNLWPFFCEGDLSPPSNNGIPFILPLGGIYRHYVNTLTTTMIFCEEECKQKIYFRINIVQFFSDLNNGLMLGPVCGAFEFSNIQVCQAVDQWGQTRIQKLCKLFQIFRIYPIYPPTVTQLFLYWIADEYLE